jgi:hypothetical protein
VDYVWGETKIEDLFEKWQCLYCLDNFLWRQRNPSIQQQDRIFTDRQVTMVYTTLGSLQRSETPEHDFFTVDENGNKIINFLHVPWLPTNPLTQVDTESLQVGRSLPFGRRWDCKWTQTDKETPASTQEQAIQTDDCLSYGSTDYWLDVSSGPQNSTSQSGNPRIMRQLAIHTHLLDQLGLDSGGLQKFSDNSFHTDNATLGAVAINQWGYKFCQFHDKHTNHSSNQCLFPHITCMPGIGLCKVPKDHLYYGGGCLLDSTYEEIQCKRKHWELLSQMVEESGASSSRCKTDNNETGGTVS